MSEETKVTQPVNENTEATEATETKQEETKTFTQDQLNNIIEQRIMAERRKYEKKIQEEEKYVNTFKQIGIDKGFYFSYTYDLTHSL